LPSWWSRSGWAGNSGSGNDADGLPAFICGRYRRIEEKAVLKRPRAMRSLVHCSKTFPFVALAAYSSISPAVRI